MLQFYRKKEDPKEAYEAETQIAYLSKLLEAYEQLKEKYDSSSWKWLVDSYLPAERLRIMEARNTIQIGDTVKQAIAQGQLNEIENMKKELANVDETMRQLRAQLGRALAVQRKHARRSGDGQSGTGS